MVSGSPVAGRLFSKPANLLVLDEPTNDLDVETLELLEEVLLTFPGTVLMVSHDRAFLDNVVTSTLVFEGEGKVREYVGGYQDWLRQGGSPRLLGVGESKAGKPELATAVVPAPVEAAPVAADASKKKLSYKLQREAGSHSWADRCAGGAGCQLAGADRLADFYQQPAEKTAEVLAKLQAVQHELETLVERWAELEG